MTEAQATDATPAARAAGAPRLRILVVEFLPSGGMFQFAFQFADALAADGNAVRLLTGPRPELASKRRGLKVRGTLPTWHPNAELGGGKARRTIRRAWRAALLVESWRRVLTEVRRAKPDVVQFGELRYPLDSLGFLLVAMFGRAGAVVDVAHNPVPYDVHSKDGSVEKTGRLNRGLLDRAYRAADLVLVLSEKPKGELLAAFPGLPRVAICGHGDYSSVMDSEGIAAPSANGPTALFFGAWTKYKNIPLLLESFRIVRETLPDARLTIAGPPMPDVDLDAITAQASAIGGVDLRPGYVAIEDVPALFGSNRAVVFTYDTVNVSGSVHMAYTFGRPVVASDVGAMGEIVEDGVTGLLAAHDASDIAGKLLTVLQDDAAADRMGAAASERTHDDSSWSATSAKATVAYREALAG